MFSAYPAQRSTKSSTPCARFRFGTNQGLGTSRRFTGSIYFKAA